MSDEKEAAKSVGETPKPARRESAVRPRRAPKAESIQTAPEVVADIDAPGNSGDFESSTSGESDDSWPEPEGASTGGIDSPPEHGKKKRRRRKGKGPQGHGPAGQPHGDEAPIAVESKPPEQREPRPSNGAPAPHQPQRQRHEPDQLATKAWKIYISEVGEEGVALIGDNDAKELARRCFRLAEIFMDEQLRHR